MSFNVESTAHRYQSSYQSIVFKLLFKQSCVHTLALATDHRPRYHFYSIPLMCPCMCLKPKQGGAHCVVLIAHRGRPGGNYSRANFTLEPCVQVLQEHFPTRVVGQLSGAVSMPSLLNTLPFFFFDLTRMNRGYSTHLFSYRRSNFCRNAWERRSKRPLGSARLAPFSSSR